MSHFLDKLDRLWLKCCNVCAKDRDCVCMPSRETSIWGVSYRCECLWVRFSAIQMIDNSSIFLCFYISFVGFNHKYLLGCVLKWSCRGQCCPIYAHCRPAQVFPASHGYTVSSYLDCLHKVSHMCIATLSASKECWQWWRNICMVPYYSGIDKAYCCSFQW